MPEGVSVAIWVIPFGQITIDVLHGRLNDIHGVLELGEEACRHEDVVFPELVGSRQQAGFVRPLTVAASAILDWAPGAGRRLESCPTPHTSPGSCSLAR